jgi:hypothetical protein
MELILKKIYKLLPDHKNHPQAIDGNLTVMLDKELLTNLVNIFFNNDTIQEHKWHAFRRYWEKQGKPPLESRKAGDDSCTWADNYCPLFNEKTEYRLKGDNHWKLRLEWINSDYTLPIFYREVDGSPWMRTANPMWLSHWQYIDFERLRMYKGAETWDKFKTYWEDLGKPAIESSCELFEWHEDENPKWLPELTYRIKDDKNWEARLAWVNSDCKAKVYLRKREGSSWLRIKHPVWTNNVEYTVNPDKDQ